LVICSNLFIAIPMFFVLSKILAFLLKPLNLIVLTALYGLFTRIPQRRQRAFTVLIFMLLGFSTPWPINELARRWEIGQRSPESIVEPYDVGILLGGYTEMSAASPAGVVTFSRSANRLTETLALYKMGKIRRILLTGGSGRMIGEESSEAPVSRWYLQQVGVPDSAIIIEGHSRNTWENALYSKQLIDSLAPGSRCLLITSAWHLRRAKGCLDKAGLPCEVFGADFFTLQDLGNKLHWLQPSWECLMKWNYLLKEWVGWLVYKIKGYN